MTAEFAPSAKHDLVEAVRWIERENPRTAEVFSEAVIAAARRIGQRPFLGRIRPDLSPAPWRFLLLGDFPYLIAYDADVRPPMILRILHTARDIPSLLKAR